MTNIIKNFKLKPNAQKLRKTMTKEERHLWYDFLKTLPITIHRQKVIGNYIVDFYCASKKLVIELDGGQHYNDENIEYDIKRTAYFNSIGISVLRYTNEEVNKNFDSVCMDIMNYIGV